MLSFSSLGIRCLRAHLSWRPVALAWKFKPGTWNSTGGMLVIRSSLIFDVPLYAA